MIINAFKVIVDVAKSIINRANKWQNVVIHTLPYAKTLVAQDVQSFFDQQKGPDGKPWTPKKGGGILLNKTGKLRRSAIAAARAIRYINGVGLQAEMSDPHYGVFQDFGTYRIPSRPFFGATQKTVTKIFDVLGIEYLQFLVGGFITFEFRAPAGDTTPRG